jgi:DNA-directed RNA polymerase subunit H (RpoH/RPB5)|tara:strand:+ start:206 stop:391 length:186 start_codon:yes stop_codon:yes gene_type:complete
MRILFSILLFSSCVSNKYEVIQRVHENQWHTQNIKNKSVIIYNTELKLKPGDIVKIPNKSK